MVIFFIYASIVMICLMSCQVYYLLPNKSAFDKIVFRLLLVMLFHVSFAAIFIDIVKGYQYVDRGAPLGLLYGPILYFAFMAYEDKYPNIKTVFLHFTPFLIFLGIYFYFLTSEVFRVNFSKTYYFVLYSSFGLSWMIYPIFIMFKGKGLDIAMSNIKRIFYFSIILLLVLAAFILPLISAQFLTQIRNTSQLSTITIYMIMLFGAIIIYNYLLKELVDRKTVPTEFDFLNHPFPMVEAENPILELQMPNHRLTNYQDRVLNYLNQQPYLDPGFNLDTMVKDLKMSRSMISQFFKEYFKQNVLKTINSLRIEAVCKELEQPDFDMNIEELALRCGFSSRASFYRNFSLEKDCTPVEYREQVKSKLL